MARRRLRKLRSTGARAGTLSELLRFKTRSGGGDDEQDNRWGLANAQTATALWLVRVSVVLISMSYKGKGKHPAAADTAQQAPTLANRDYGVDVDPVAGFVKRWEDRDAFVEKASIVYTVHEMSAAREYAWDMGAKRFLEWEEVTVEVDDDGVPCTKTEWWSDMKVWGNYQLSDGDTIHGWYVEEGREPQRNEPDFIAHVHGDGVSGTAVEIASGPRPKGHLRQNWFCMVVQLRQEIQQEHAWSKVLHDMRKPLPTPEPLHHRGHTILSHLVQWHRLNPAQALSVRQVLDGNITTSALTGGAGTGKSKTLVACIKVVLMQQGMFDLVNPSPSHPDTIHVGKHVGGLPSDTAPRSCLLVTAPTNAQVDNLLERLQKEAETDQRFQLTVLGDHPCPWLRSRARRAVTPPHLARWNQEQVQETLAGVPGCKATLRCCLNNCRVLFATAGMVATRRKLLLTGLEPEVRTRFVVSFVDKASRHSIAFGLDLASLGSKSMVCGDPGQLRPYSHIALLALAAQGNIKPEPIAWPAPRYFRDVGVDAAGDPRVEFYDSYRYSITSVFHFCLYRSRCSAAVLAQQYRMGKPLAILVRSVFTGGSTGEFQATLPDSVLQKLRIVDRSRSS